VKIYPILSCIFFLLFPHLSPAQILVGPAIGSQSSWVSFDDKDQRDLYTVKPVKGFHAGATLSFRVRKRFFLHSSVLYSVKGKIIEGKDDPLLRNEVRYHYLDVPILYTVDFRVKLKGTKEFKYYFGLGPNVSYWLDGKGKISSSDLAELQIREQPYSVAFKKSLNEIKQNEMGVEDPNRIQLGLNLAGGIVFEPFGYQKIMLTFRYELGHSFFSRTTNGTFQQTYYQDIMQSRNEGIRITLAYLIDLQVENRKKGKSTIKQKRR
jgi:outer membrane protein with beta-barrel domain